MCIRDSWRDQAAFQLGTILQAEDPLGLDDRYWSLQKFFGTTLNGTYWDGVIYPGGSGANSVSAQSNPLLINGEEGSAAGFQQNMGYYPRGTASLGLTDAVAGLILDAPGGALYYQPQVFPLRVPVYARADWGNPNPAARVPTLYFPNGGSSPTITLSLIHISEPTRLGMTSYAVFCLKKKKKMHNQRQQ